jgi:ATP-dependent Lhr-like helicase
MFHPAVHSWFTSTFPSATPVQVEAWAAIRGGDDVLIAAPTGSGKTLAAFLCAINELVEQSQKGLPDEGVQVLYVSPLKALSNDIEKNLRHPLMGVDRWLQEHGHGPSGIRAMVRTGDTTPGEREQMRRRPPHILVTTPESLYLLLTSASGRGMLATVRHVIVDEIHAVVGNKRGSHLALSLSRLDPLLPQRARRIGLSATQKPIEQIANFLSGGLPCKIVDTGHQRERDLQIEMPASPLSAVMANEVWEEIYDRLQQLVAEHRTTLIFVNTRRLAERLTRHLAERLGEDAVTAHHGSLSRRHRLGAEQALKNGQLRALVATASLELGIDIGHVDLVCQLGSPGSISGFIQRVGRAGHSVGATPKGRLFPLTRDDLVESMALLRAVQQGLLDMLTIPAAPLDVLTQQLVAEISAREWDSTALFALVQTAWPYRELGQETFDQVIDMLAAGYATRRGRRAAYIYHDAINGRLRARPGARLTALQNGGAIPDQFDYEVTLQPQGFRVGTLNEDFAFESIPGDIFQLGNSSYRILKIEQGRVLVDDAHGQPPTIPFWLGDAPGRSDELSAAVSNLCEELQNRLRADSPGQVENYLHASGFSLAAAQQTVAYLSAILTALGCIPTQKQMVLERFFDATGDMHLVIHAPLGSRIMRAWGLALRKRFCRHFNFELQAAALEDSLILSLGETHSFATESIPAFLQSSSVRQLLVQALLDAPMFAVRWRWNASIALAVQRMRNGQKLPPQWQRNQAEDLVAVVFPDQLACLENIRGEREIPQHPLVTQTIGDCLHETMDIEGLERVLQQLESGLTEMRCLDLTAPSPLAAEIINARPYAFLDDGDAENRRTRAITQDSRDLEHAAMLRIISIPAIEQVRAECWIMPRNPDELHDGLLQCGFLTQQEFTTGCSSTGTAGDASAWGHWFQGLADELRVSCVTRPDGRQWWVATERLGEFLSLNQQFAIKPDPSSVWPLEPAVSRERARVELVRSRLAGLGPVTVEVLSADLGLPAVDINQALLALQNEGYVIQMSSATQVAASQWCERRLLARIHRYSREQRRHASRPVSPAAFMRFLVAWHGLDAPAADFTQVLSLLEGWVAPLAAWEPVLLHSRCRDYTPQALDQLMLGGQLGWFRPVQGATGRQQIVAATPICLVSRQRMGAWQHGGEVLEDEVPAVSQAILVLLRREGAMFTTDLQQRTGLLLPQIEQALGTLVVRGLVTADAFSPLRWLIRPEAARRRQLKSAQRHAGFSGADMLGRWSAVRFIAEKPAVPSQDELASLCAALLRRYGVVFRAVLERESLAPPWRHLLRYLRRMEDRGEVHGGRFVDGFSGEQFALAEAIGLLRQHTLVSEQHQLIVIGASDPLNLGGVITPGVRTAAVNGHRILLCDGVPLARMQGEALQVLDETGVIPLQQIQRRLSNVHELRHGRTGGH